MRAGIARRDHAQQQTDPVRHRRDDEQHDEPDSRSETAARTQPSSPIRTRSRRAVISASSRLYGAHHITPC